MSWHVLGWLALAGLLIGLLLWRRFRRSREIAWPGVHPTRGKDAALPHAAAQSGAWLSAGGIDNRGHGPDAGDGSSPGSGH